MKPVPVDLVMATNRASPYLRLALGAVAAQTYPHWNLTVVDDGTPDPKVVPEFTAGMANTRVLRRPRSGLPASRNAGMAVGRAPLIAFLDDDDVWEPDKLAAQVAALEAEPQAIACFTAGRYIDGEGREFGRGWAAHSVPSELFVSGQEPQPRIVSLMVRRTANEDVGGFNESYSVGEDNEYILRLALHGPMVAVPRPLISYRRHDHNMSSADSLSGRWAARRMLRELSAARGDDARAAELLDENRARFVKVAADECVRSLRQAVRRRDPKAVGAELRWAVTSPGRTLAAATRRLIAAR